MIKIAEYRDKLEKLGLKRKWWKISTLFYKEKKSWQEKPYHILNNHLFINRTLNLIWNKSVIEMIIDERRTPYLTNIGKQLDVFLIERLIYEIPEFKTFVITIHSNGTLNNEYEYPFKKCKN